jgi:uncharacterized membrane protein
MEAAMGRKIAILLVLVGGAASAPAQALAQAQNPPADNWPGPWFMWGAWPSWWWICPLMMVVIMLVMMFACRFMWSRRRD